MRIIAIDPGGYTGLATFTAQEMPNGELYDVEWQRMWLGPDEHHKKLDDFLSLQHVEDTRVVIESFEYRNKHRDGLVLISLEYIGVTKRWCHERGVPLQLQTAAMAKGFVQDFHLEALGLLVKPVSKKPQKDMNDALRHLVYYMVNTDKRYVKEILEKAFKH